MWRLSVWLSASNSKTRAWIWMTFCVSTCVGTRTNWTTFEPDPDHSADAGTGLLLRYRMDCNAEFYYVRIIPCTYRYWAGVLGAHRSNDVWFWVVHALQRGILLRRENPTYRYWACIGIGGPSQQRRVVLRRRNTFVEGKCALPSALLVTANVNQWRSSLHS